MPAQTFRHVAIAETGAAEAWRALQLPDTWATIGGVDRIHSPRYLPDGDLAGYEFVVTVAGISYPGSAVTAVRRVPETMVMKISSPEMTGQIEILLTPAPAGTGVAVTLTARSRGFLSTLAFPLIAASIGRGLPENVERFAASLG